MVCIKTPTPEIEHVEHVGSDMSQFDIAILAGQSVCGAQSGKSQGLSADDMPCGCSCIAGSDCAIIRDASWAATGLTGHISGTATRIHSTDCVIRLITPNL